MKLYRMANGRYTMRKDQPMDAWGRPVWKEVQIAFHDNGQHIRLYPSNLPEDKVTLSLTESRLFRLRPTASQLELALWFRLREPDRLLARFMPTYAEFNDGKATYAEWGERSDHEAMLYLLDCEDREDERDLVCDAIQFAALRTQGVLP